MKSVSRRFELNVEVLFLLFIKASLLTKCCVQAKIVFSQKCFDIFHKKRLRVLLNWTKRDRIFSFRQLFSPDINLNFPSKKFANIRVMEEYQKNLLTLLGNGGMISTTGRLLLITLYRFFSKKATETMRPEGKNTIYDSVFWSRYNCGQGAGCVCAADLFLQDPPRKALYSLALRFDVPDDPV